MKIAPIDITHKTFTKKVLGYAIDEVSEFMHSVAEEFEEVIRERNRLRESLREKELSIMEYKERDEVLKNTIMTATQMAETMRKDAEREGDLIIQEAGQKAEAMVQDARESLKKIYEEISELKKVRIQFEANLRAMANAHISMIDQAGRYMPNPIQAGEVAVNKAKPAPPPPPSASA